MRVIVCDQIIETECDPILQVGEDRYYGAHFTANGNVQQITVKVQALDENGNVLAENECSIQVKFADLNVTFATEIRDGKQQFSVNINNIGDIATGATVYVYLNGELYSQERIYMDTGRQEAKVYSFEEINEGDWIYLSVVADEDEENISDNYTTMFSVQNEQRIVQIINPHEDSMRVVRSI